MAVYFLNLKTFGRSAGSSAVSAAAYRSGERIHDERTGKTYDHSDRQDVMHKEIILPSRFADSDMSWARDRATLWNSAEGAESRKNARVAREYLVALPVELNPEQRIHLVQGFSRELTDRYRFALDVAVHAPRDFPDSDPRNFHAHLLATTREVTTDGLAAKTTLELNDEARRERGLAPAINELLFVRERWAAVTNQALREAHIDTRIDHRSLAAQGIDREPYPYIPRAAYEMERHGYRSGLAERLRQEYQERLQARSERTEHATRDAPELRAARSPAMSYEAPQSRGPAATYEAPTSHGVPASHQVLGSGGAPSSPAGSREEPTRSGPSHSGARLGSEPPPMPTPAAASPAPRQTLEDIRRQAREDWLRMRAEAPEKPTTDRKHSRDDEFSR